MSLADVVIPLAVGLAFVGMGWTLGIQGQVQAKQGAEVTVEGTVVSTDVDRYRGQDSGKYKYDPTVTYRYSYEGETYTSSNVYAGPGVGRTDFDSRSKAESFLDGYPEGSTVTVHLDPEDPGSAFLERDAPIPAIGYWAFAVGGLVVAAYGGWNAVKLVRGTSS